MKCAVCGCEDFTQIGIFSYCKRCGICYDDDGNIFDVDKVALKVYAKELIDNIEDDLKREYIRGLFEGYYNALFDKRKKVRTWGLMKCAILLKELNEMDLVNKDIIA